MANDIASLDHEYHIVTRMYSIARNFDMSIPAEELALYQTLMPSFYHLKVSNAKHRETFMERAHLPLLLESFRSATRTRTEFDGESSGTLFTSSSLCSCDKKI